MRKHSTKFATRWSREDGDRSNFPQRTAHEFVNNKFAQFAANSLLQTLFLRAGCLQPAQGFEAPATTGRYIEQGIHAEELGRLMGHSIGATDESIAARLRRAFSKFF